jgi:hypothetical protein
VKAHRCTGAAGAQQEAAHGPHAWSPVRCGGLQGATTVHQPLLPSCSARLVLAIAGM